MQELYIREDWQRRGLGTQIMRLVEQLADEYEAEVYVNVIMSEEFWSKTGYVPGKDQYEYWRRKASSK